MKELLLQSLVNGTADDVKEVCETVGINVANCDGAYKTTYEVLNELASIWNDIK